jgi:5-(carboxyamino)imidazole ribonucleotide synthase
MTAFAAKRMGFDIAVLEKEKNSPAGQLTHKEFKGSFSNRTVLKKFAAASDIITLENEFVDYTYIEFLESLGKIVFPSSKTISFIQDKYVQKKTLSKNNIPVPCFLSINHKNDFEILKSSLGLPFILKSRKMGYDGYGNALVRSKNDFENAFDRLVRRHSKLMAEEFIDFEMELAVMVARTKKEIRAYPVVQTVQKNHICHMVLAPAGISPKLLKQAKEIGIESVKAVKGFGLFGIELFLDRSGKLLVNEMAPRPHNSGHYTIEGCVTSQFENHVRSVLNLPLGSAEMLKPHAVMINILGKKNNSGTLTNYNTVLKNNKVHLHLYGKEHSRTGRKMGHITVTGENINSLITLAKKAEKEIVI